MIPDNDPVRLLNACVEGMDLSELYKTYTRVPKNLATPKQLFKIVAYAAMNGTYSSRKIEAACRQNINYMYLLEGKPAPDNATIARFISLHLSQCSKELMAESTWLLRRNCLISLLLFCPKRFRTSYTIPCVPQTKRSRPYNNPHYRVRAF